MRWIVAPLARLRCGRVTTTAKRSTSRVPTVAVPEPINAWDRRVDETPPAWEAFQCYRDLGLERSVAGVRAQLGKSRTIFERWCARHSWVARCELWDAAQDAERQRARLGAHRQAIIDMDARHAAQAESWLRTMERVVRELLFRIVDADQKNERPFEDVELTELIGMARTIGPIMPRVVEMERLARGIPQNEPVDENKMRATLRAELELNIEGGAGEAPDNREYMVKAIQALVEAGAIPGVVVSPRTDDTVIE